MVPILALWLPILVSAVIVFVASSIMHMVLPFHRSDYGKLQHEGRRDGGDAEGGRQPGRLSAAALLIAGSDEGLGVRREDDDRVRWP